MPIRALLQFFVVIALAFAPICGMGAPAMAMPGAMQAAGHHAMATDQAHCARMGGEQQHDSGGEAGLDCAMASPAVLAAAPHVPEAPVTASVPQRAAIAVVAPGLNPAAELRPPRLS
jgi:hypothetical protein